MKWKGWLTAAPLVAAVAGVVSGCDVAISDERSVPLAVPLGRIETGPVVSAIAVANNDIVPPLDPRVDFLPPDCSVDGCPISTDPCSTYVCASTTRTCVLKLGNGAACDDGNLCTRNDICVSGKCQSGAPVTCTASDQCHDVGVCLPATGTCSNPLKPEGSGCNDGRACTTADKCTAGVCGGTVSCPASDQCHLAGACDGTGRCTNPTKPENTPCNDLSVCTRVDVCVAGVCRGQDPTVCAAPDQCHDPGTCDSRTGVCAYPVKPVGTGCNDGMPCTWGDACTAGGACLGMAVTPPCVSDESADRVCNGTQTCTVTPRPGAACNDGNPCTKGDVRKADGSCAGMLYQCPVTACLTASRCDGLGGCVSTAKPDGTGCDADGSKCTPADRCQAGACVRDPKPVECVAKDCNTVACDPATGNCVYRPVSGESCGVTGCYTAGTCTNGTCSGVPRDCSSFDNPCGTGICDARTGGCVTAHKPNGTSCDPGGRCATGALCAFGVCEPAPASCPAATGPCKVPACDPETETCHENDLPAGTACDPKTSCMGPGMCDDQGRCLGGPLPNGTDCAQQPSGLAGLCFAGLCTSTLGVAIPGDGGGGSADGPDAAGGGKLGGDKAGCGCVVRGGEEGGAAGGSALLAAVAVAVTATTRRRRRGRRP